jgi:putative ferrous iron transport protein C
MNILLDVRDYLQAHRQAGLNDLARHFDSNPDAMRGMLEIWVAKGRIRHCPAFACAGCAVNCSSAPGDSYEWMD